MATKKAEKITDHNGKPVRTFKGKTVRIPEDAWKIISKHCAKKALVMGSFVANAALAEIKKK